VARAVKVGFRFGGINMTIPLTEGATIKCANNHTIGTVGTKARKGVSSPAFRWTQKPTAGVPMFKHVCTNCGAAVAWPTARAKTF
jgi:hypothetical protein